MQVKRRPRHRLHAQVHRSPAGHHPRPARELRTAFPRSAHDLPGQLRRAGGAAFSVPGRATAGCGSCSGSWGDFLTDEGGEGPAAGPAPVPDSGDRGGRGPARGAGRAFRPAGQDPQQREDRRGGSPWPRHCSPGTRTGGGILSELDQAAAALERVVPFLPEGEACAQKLREAQYALEDADGLLDSLPVEFDPAAPGPD